MPWHGLLPEELSDVERLGEMECWNLLGDATVGRLAVRAADGIDIFPVNFTVHDHAVYIRSAPGSKLIDIVHASSVAFEIDAEHGHTHWSVVVRGTAERLIHDSDIQASGVLQLATLTSSAKWNYVRITPSSISGRRFSSVYS